MKIRIKLIPDWHRAWRFFSMQLAAILASLSALQAGLPDVQPWFPPQTFARITLGLSALIMLLRMIKQFQDAEGPSK